MEILEKLEGLVPRFEEVSTLITDPNVIADQKRYVQLTKEYKNLEEIMKARQEYINAVKGLEEAKEMLTMEDDPEMKEMLTTTKMSICTRGRSSATGRESLLSCS